jgi:DNA-binding transcriptional LysR family regulator
MDIEIRLLQCALKLAEHSNFARAAKALHMSQPSLSRNIQELERRLGVSLFLRNRHGVEPTAAGSILLEHAAGVVGRASDLVHEMNLLRGLQKSELSIGAGVYPGQMFVDRAVGQLVRDHPAVRLSIVYDNAYLLLPRLLKREFDFAVMYMSAPDVDQQLEVIELRPHQVFFSARAGHPLFRRNHSASLPEILEYPLVAPGRLPASSIKRFRAASRQQGPRLASQSIPSVGCDAVAMMRTVVMESDAVGILPLNVLLPEVQAGTLAAFSIIEPWLKPSFSIVRLKRRALSPLGAKLIRLITESDEALAEWESHNIDALFGRKPTRTKIPKKNSL